MGLTLLSHAAMPLKFWVEAFQTTIYLINLLPFAPLQFCTPVEMLSLKSPTYLHLQPFGCACFPYLRPYTKHKFNFHSTKCIFIGYNHGHAGYKCWTLLIVYMFLDMFFLIHMSFLILVCFSLLLRHLVFLLLLLIVHLLCSFSHFLPLQ